MRRKFQIYFIMFAFCLLAGTASFSGTAAASDTMDGSQEQETVPGVTDENQGTVSGGTDENQGTVSGGTDENQGTVSGGTDENQGTVSGGTDENQGTVSGETDENQGTVPDGTDGNQGTVSDGADENQDQTEVSGNTEKKRGWVTLKSGAKKYFNEEGTYVTGLKKIDGKTYSFNAHGHLQINKWVSYNGNKYRTDKNGAVIKKKLVKINKKVFYFNKNGVMCTGWKKIDGKKHYFRSNGVMVVGMIKISGKYYYFETDGSLKKNEWISYDGSRYRADNKGVIIRGKFIKVDGKTYYLKKNGTVYTGWGTVNGKKAYFYSDGAMAVGLTEIDGKYYYFDTDGTMKTGTVEADGITYYMADDGVLEARKEKNVYYDSSDKKMTDVEALDFETLQRAKKIVSEITDSSMSQAQKLRKCFDWVMAKTYLTRRKFTNAPGWIALYANDHFIYGSGNCQSDAAAFGYLAKALGYTEVYMCVDSKGSGHSWTEIDGLVYDPLFAQAKSFSQNYGVKYGVYKLRAIQHVKI